MKLLIFFLLIPFVGATQIFDGRVTIKADSSWSGKVSTFYYVEKQDTLSAIFLCSDTTGFPQGLSYFHRGYVIIHRGWFPKPPEYLENNKKPMPGSRLVWQYILINQ